jgi:type IX secretion system PorP/SprF family membrane protein
MNKLKAGLIIAVILTVKQLNGQVADSAVVSLACPVFSQYLQNGLMVNPAYSGTRGALSTFLSYRMQWMGTAGSPVIQTASLHTPMKNDRVALGIMGHFMQYGVTRSMSLYANYAYHIRVGRSGKLSFGIKGGLDRSETDYSGILLSNAGDPVFSENDKPYILPNAGAGVYYFSEKLFAGVSVPSFLSYSRTATGSVQAFHSFDRYKFIFTAGGLITFSPFFKFKPSLLVDYSLQQSGKLTQFDINGNVILGDLLWLGGSWRTTEEVAVGILQVQVNPQLMIGCSYDYPAGRMNSFSRGSSEFILRYEFGYKVSAANPRYF